MAASKGTEERASAFQHSLRFLNGHGPRLVQAELAALAQGVDAEVLPDLYGSGAVIEELEADVAALLGKPAAVFMPSGTMAQQIVMRVHAERARCRTIAFHPTCHLRAPRAGRLPPPPRARALPRRPAPAFAHAG